MNSRVTVNEVTDLSGLDTEGSIFKGLLHIPASEKSKIASVSSRSAFTALLCNASEILKGFNLCLDFYIMINYRSSYTVTSDPGDGFSL